MRYLTCMLWLTMLLPACGGSEATPAPTANPEPVTFAITAPFDSRQLTPDNADGAPVIEAGETAITWEPVPGAAQYDVWILDRSNPATLSRPVPGEEYTRQSTDQTSWEVNLVVRPGMDEAGREMSVEVSAYDAGGQLVGFTGRYVFWIGD